MPKTADSEVPLYLLSSFTLERAVDVHPWLRSFIGDLTTERVFFCNEMTSSYNYAELLQVSHIRHLRGIIFRFFPNLDRIREARAYNGCFIFNELAGVRYIHPLEHAKIVSDGLLITRDTQDVDA